MIRSLLSLSVFCLSLSLLGADIKLIAENGPEIELEMKLNPEETTPKKVKAIGQSFLRMPIEGEGFHFGSEGLPELPKLHRWLVVHSKSKYRMEVYPGAFKTYRNVVVYPAQPDTLETEVAPFKMLPGAYLKNTWYGNPKVALGSRAKLGELTILPLVFSPMAFNPMKRELRVYDSFRVRLTNLEPDFNYEPIEISQFVAAQVAELALNGKQILSRNGNIREGKKIVLVHSRALKTSAQELAEIHRAQGNEVLVIEAITGMKPTALQQLLKNQYKSHSMDAVLIFGDEVAIPLRESGGEVGDYSYSLLAGSDSISDISIGRLPAKNETQGKIIVGKIRKYLELKTQGYRNKKVMLVAHSEDYPGKYTKNMEDIRKSPNPRELEFNTQYGGESATNSTVLEELKKGYAIINYRGHGSATAWSSWGKNGASFSAQQVRALSDDERSLPFIFNVACTNGAIQNSSLALVEHELFPNQSESSFQGAVGTFGATAPSLTQVNHRFNSYLFGFLQSGQDGSIGNVYTLANNKLTKDNGGKPTSNTQMYVLFSDPLLEPWI